MLFGAMADYNHCSPKHCSPKARGAIVKVFLLGATGNSGRRILRLALQRAHEVTAFVRDETKLLNLVDRPIPPNLHVSLGDISKSADIARLMVGHDVAINAAGRVTEGSTFTLVQTVVDSAIASLGEGRALTSSPAAIEFSAMTTDGLNSILIAKA